MNWKTIFRSLKNKDMQKRLLIVFGIIIAYRFLAHVPVPITDPTELREVVSNLMSSSDFGGFFNLLTGGALVNFSIVMVGMGPFITASIIVQLMTKAIPKLEEIHKDGEMGRRKIQQWTRIISLPLAVIQSIAFIFILQQTVLQGNSTTFTEMSIQEWIVAVTAMVAGSMLLMWMGELITEQGIGNGISLVIFASVVSQLPMMFSTLGQSILDTSAGKLNMFGWFELPVNPTAFYVTLAIIVISLVILYILVKVNEAQRIITINYAKRTNGNSVYTGVKSILPLKLLAAGVIPIIFAMAMLSLPAFIGQVLKATGNPDFMTLANNLINWFQAPDPGTFTGATAEAFIYPVLYFLLVIAFTYFYTGIAINTNEIAENLQNQGGFIEGVRPGAQTEAYLNDVIRRLILFGSLIIGFVAVMPFIIEYGLYHIAGVSSPNLAVGGTGLLIVVTVALDTLRQINSRALMVTYDDYK